MLQDSNVAIILAKLNPGADGTASSVRPYRLEAGARDFTPIRDDSDETLSGILRALKLQVAGRDNDNDLNQTNLLNATPTEDSLELEGKIAPPERSKANDSADVKQMESRFTSLENLAEAYTEPTYESVIQSRADDGALMEESPSTLPTEHFDDNNNYEPKSNMNLNIENDEIIPFKDESIPSIESEIAFRLEPTVSEPADTNAADEEELVMANIIEPEPTPCSQTEDGAIESRLADSTPTPVDSQCDACKQGGSECEGCKQDDVLNSPPGSCPAVPMLKGRNAEELPEDQKDEIIDTAIKKQVGLRINRKSYKISIIFQ